MATIVFTQNLRRHINIDKCTVTGTTVNEALAQVFKDHPRMRGYLLDDSGAVRTHVAILLNGQSIKDRQSLSDKIHENAKIYVVQALSGG